MDQCDKGEFHSPSNSLLFVYVASDVFIIASFLYVIHYQSKSPLLIFYRLLISLVSEITYIIT